MRVRSRTRNPQSDSKRVEEGLDAEANASAPGVLLRKAMICLYQRH